MNDPVEWDFFFLFCALFLKRSRKLDINFIDKFDNRVNALVSNLESIFFKTRLQDLLSQGAYGCCGRAIEDQEGETFLQYFPVKKGEKLVKKTFSFEQFLLLQAFFKDLVHHHKSKCIYCIKFLLSN